MKTPLKLKQIRRIAIIRTDRIGEVLLSTPVIEALSHFFKDAEISFVTSAYSSGIIEPRPDIKDVILFDTFSKRPPLLSALELSNKLKPGAFDIALILNPHRVLHLGCYLAGIPIRAGFNRKWPFLLTHRAHDNRAKAIMHEVEYNLEFLRIIDIYADKIPPSMPVSSKESGYVEALLKSRGIKEDSTIVSIHPGSSNAKKRWDIGNFRKVVSALSETGRISMLIIGDKNERALGKEIISGTKENVYDMTGLFTIGELAALLKASRLLITNDNGPMHMAAAVGTRVIALFNKDAAGSDPKRWGPYGEGHIVFYKPVNEITPDEVIQSSLNIVQ